MTLRSRLSLWFALFAALPLLAVFVPVGLVLRQALEREHALRLDSAVRAVDGEMLRLSAAASAGVRDLAGRAEVAALARELAEGLTSPPDAAGLVAAWGRARGLDVLSLCEPDGRVVASAHLPGRAGDVDAAAARLLGEAAEGTARPLVIERAGGAELERALAVVAWAPLEGGGRIVGGVTLGGEALLRLVALTGGAVVLRDGDGASLGEAAGPDDGGLERSLGRLAGALSGARRVVPLLPPGAAARGAAEDPGAGEARPATIEVTLASAGLVRAWLVVLAAFGALLAAATLAAALLGRRLAARETAPLEALRAAAARVAGGDLTARVGVEAAGEVGELVRAFDAMTGELAQGRERLAVAERVAAWRDVARALAHELKNPLTPIAMSVELLRDARGRPGFEEVLDESTRAIGEEVRRLRRIVDEFSRFARMPAPALAPLPAGELAQALLALFPAAPPGVALVREVAPGLPVLRADRDQLLQVLHNLVKNALEAMPEGGTLTLRAARDGDGVSFEIGDTGTGIPPELLPRIFEPWVTTKPGGTGLGLAIAARIVEEHGGRIAVASRPGAGTTFTVRLPPAGLTSPASP
jgi:nitrogen fixation/metabolism regulation signal transduction histidine kinase